MFKWADRAQKPNENKLQPEEKSNQVLSVFREL